MSVADSAITVMLLNIWVQKLVVRMVNELHKLRSPSESTSVMRDPVMMADQNVPYNITGFTAMKLNLSSQLSSKRAESDSLIKQITTLEPQQAGHFVDKYDTWICKQSRSGLRYPIPDFYLPVRKLDITCRQVVVSKGLSAFSLNKTIIVKTMLQILMVQHYWKKIVAARIVA